MEKRHTQKKTEGMVMGESTFRSHVPEAVQLGMGTARAVGGVVVYISFQFWAASVFFFLFGRAGGAEDGHTVWRPRRESILSSGRCPLCAAWENAGSKVPEKA